MEEQVSMILIFDLEMITWLPWFILHLCVKYDIFRL